MTSAAPVHRTISAGPPVDQAVPDRARVVVAGVAFTEHRTPHAREKASTASASSAVPVATSVAILVVL